MAVKTAKQDLIRAIGAEAYDWCASHSKTSAAWANGPAILWGHLACDPSGRETQMAQQVGAKAFGAWLVSAYKADKDALLVAARVTYETRKGTKPEHPILGTVLEWCFGRPHGTHTQGWSAAVESGDAENRSAARDAMRYQAGLDGWQVGLGEQAALQSAYQAIQAGKKAAVAAQSEAEKYEARKAALSAAAKKAAETRKANALKRKSLA